MKLRHIFLILAVFASMVVMPVFCLAQQAKDVKAKEPAAADMEKQRKQITDYFKKGDDDSAIKLGEEYLKVDSVNIEVLVTLAESYSRKNNFAKAAEITQKAIAIAPNNTWVLKATAKVQRMNAEQDKSAAEKKALLDSAEKTIGKALSINPKDAWANAEAALIYLDRGDKVNASKFIKNALDIEPNDEYFKTVKAQIESGAGK